MSWGHWTCAALGAQLLLGANALATSWGDVPITNFAEVSPGIYRGGHPDEEGMAALARLGVKTEIDLEFSPKEIVHEVDRAANYGIRMYAIPMMGLAAPKARHLDETLKLLADPAMRPIFVHCRHGEDRTGLVVGLHRVLNEGWKPVEAYAEMLRMGFHRKYIGLRRAFRKETGYDPE